MSTDIAQLIPLHTGLFFCRNCCKEYRVFRATREQLRCKLCAQRLVNAPDQVGYVLEVARRLLSKRQRQHQPPPRWMLNLLVGWVDALPTKKGGRVRP